MEAVWNAMVTCTRLRKLKGKVPYTAYVCGLERETLREEQQSRVYVCKTNWIRRIARVKDK